MKKLEINYKGGFRLVSKHLTREHDANFALIIDALVYIYNENLDNLLKVGNKRAVKISNGFLSRQTGLTLDVVKRNVEIMEETGLISVIKKGQGNTRHYIIHIKRINEYIETLKGKFQQWFENSLENSKKDKARSDHYYLEQEKTSKKKYEEILEDLKNSTNQLTENQPTQKGKTNQTKPAKPTVVDTEKETEEETTTDDNSVVVQIFKNQDEEGSYYLYEVENFSKKVYLNEYKEYMERLNKLCDKDREQLNQQVSDYDYGPMEDVVIYDDLSPSELNEQINEEKENKSSWLESTPLHKIMMTIDNKIKGLKRKKERDQKRKYETEKDPASQEVSELNWEKLKEAYDELPNFENQGKFYPSKKDFENFKALSIYRQEYVISKVTAMKKSDKTASRPAIYIEEAMGDKLPTIKNTNDRINVMI